MSKYCDLNISHSEPLPSPYELQAELPVTRAQRNFVEHARSSIADILRGDDPRLLLIVGPCSIHDTTAAKEYALRLRELSEQVSDTFLIVMRTYFEKSRTALGWKGMLYDPHLNQSYAMDTGMRWTRQLLLDLADLSIPAAAEFLDPLSAPYFSDLISWGCIGARAAESQIHRQLASGLPMPVGFKNNTDGNIQVAVEGCVTAAAPHAYIGINEMGSLATIHSKGNSHPHIVLRGATSGTNYGPGSLDCAVSLLKEKGVFPSLLVDCSHGNSERNPDNQSVVFQSIINQYLEGNEQVRGVLLESHLNGGKQDIKTDGTKLKYAVSLTDACLDWKTTKRLIQWGYVKLKQQHVAPYQPVCPSAPR